MRSSALTASLCRLALLGALLSPSACTLDKEPLRAGWLVSGVYPQPPPHLCPPPRPPGRSYEELSRWRPPSIRANAEMKFSLPWSGTFQADVRTAGSKGPRTQVSTRARRPVRIVEDRGLKEQIPGFIAGVDLRGYRRIAFVADTSGDMCSFPACPDGKVHNNIPAELLQAMGDQIDGAVAGLGPKQSFVVYAGSAWRSMRFQPTTLPGRALAGQFVRGQVCTGYRGFQTQLQQALQDSPDVIVLLTSGVNRKWGKDDYVTKHHQCGYQPAYLYCYVDQQTEAVNMAKIANGGRLPPVIAVSVQRHDAKWLQNLAEATGGTYVDVAP